MSEELDRMAQQAIERFQSEQSMFFCDCAINLMMTTMPVESVVNYLAEQIRILEEYE